MTSASSGREALALLERGTEFNLLLTDVMMPDVDGPALLHRVREDPILHEMPVVMMSSNEHADVVLNCLRLGAEDYLLKPVTKKAVKHMWAHVWRRKQRNQMVPRFENGAEVVDEDEFDERMAAGDLAVTRNDVDGAVTVPDPDEFSSDGGSDSDSDERFRAEVDGETEAEARATGLRHEREFVANFRSGRETRAAREPMEMVREGFAEGPRSASGGGHAAPLFPVDRTTRHMPSSPTPSDASDEKEKRKDGDGLEPPLDGSAEAAMLADPLLVRDPANPEALRRLAPLAPIEGLAEGKTTIRAWLDDARRAGRAVDRGDALHVLGGAAQLLAARARERDAPRRDARLRADGDAAGGRGAGAAAAATPPERDSRAPSGVSRRRGPQSARGDAAGRAGNAEDEDEEMDEEMDERDERKMRVDAAASSAFFASAAAAPPDSEATRERDSRPLVERARERDSRQDPCNERLYVSPEERGAGGSTTTGAGAGARRPRRVLRAGRAHGGDVLAGGCRRGARRRRRAPGGGAAPGRRWRRGARRGPRGERARQAAAPARPRKPPQRGAVGGAPRASPRARRAGAMPAAPPRTRRRPAGARAASAAWPPRSDARSSWRSPGFCAPTARRARARCGNTECARRSSRTRSGNWAASGTRGTGVSTPKLLSYPTRRGTHSSFPERTRSARSRTSRSQT